MAGVLDILCAWHPLLWAVPMLSAMGMAAFGSRLSRRGLSWLGLLPLAWVLLQAAGAAVHLLWLAPDSSRAAIDVNWMTWPLFRIGLGLDRTGIWGVLLTGAATLAAQVHALYSVSRLSGRHRFYALVLMVTASASLFYTSTSRLPLLIGWEGLALSIAFMAGFWESEQRGERVGMRWLLFQRMSSLLLVAGFLAFEFDPDLGLGLVVAAAAVRAGLFPFHGWLVDCAEAPATARALIMGTGSTLAAVFLLVRFEAQILYSPFVPQVIGIVCVVTIAMGLLSGLQHHEPFKKLGWLFTAQGGLVMLGFAMGDTVASMLLATGQQLVLTGVTLASGTLVDREAAEAGTRWRSKRVYWVLAWMWLLPPSVGFVGLGRLLGSVSDSTLGIISLVAIFLAAGLGAWILQQIARDLKDHPTELAGRIRPPDTVWLDVPPAGLAALTVALGVLAVALHGMQVIGGWGGVEWAGGVAATAIAGGLLGWLVGRGRVAFRVSRLTRAQRIMDWLADTGLGLGELVVQLPVFLVRLLGVVLWRVVGDGLIDTVLLGTAVRTTEGIGIALRFLQNGRVQRYGLLAVLTCLVVVLIMTR
ncbi:MAG: hypothetical protein JXR96_16505 [Deltaproteobacteria bacterium]|nr:hypothetical protein [Deltaproteobacteria bacterium]